MHEDPLRQEVRDLLKRIEDEGLKVISAAALQQMLDDTEPKAVED